MYLTTKTNNLYVEGKVTMVLYYVVLGGEIDIFSRSYFLQHFNDPEMIIWFHLLPH